ARACVARPARRDGAGIRRSRRRVECDRSFARIRTQRAVRVRAGRAGLAHGGRARSAVSRVDRRTQRRHAVKRTRASGFTLIEVLVALAIVAVALSAGMRALAQGADGASSLKARTLALWVAQNELAKAQLADPPPSAGTTNGEAVQA